MTTAAALARHMTPRAQFERRLASLKRERDGQGWLSHWREVSENLCPRRGRWTPSERNRGNKINQKIINSTGTRASGILTAGMSSGLTSQARPWMRMGLSDKDLMEFGPVKLWLRQVEERMRLVFAESNFYNSLGTGYEDEGLFGVTAIAFEEDFDDVIRCFTFSPGEYYLATGARGTVNTFYREMDMTVFQMVEKFVVMPDKKTLDWSGVSNTVKEMWDRGDYDTAVPCAQAIEPNVGELAKVGGDRKRDLLNRPFRSVYWEVGSTKDQVCKVGGYYEFPVMAPRWWVQSGDIYGRSPGMNALGDVKQLQHGEKRKAEAIDKKVRPPMVGPGSMRGQPASILPGSMTHVDTTTGSQKFEPAFTVKPELADLRADQAEIERRINEAFYADLFLSLTMLDRRQITAREVEERHEEKLVMLGPVVDRQHDELLDPAVDRTFAVMERAGLIPPAPREIRGMPFKVEYISLLAQAQKAVGVGALERTASFVGSLAAVFPEVVDKFDADQAVDEYADMMGASPRVIRPDEQVAKIRAQRAQEKQAAQALEMANQGAAAAKVLSETELTGGTALAQIVGGGR